MTLIITKTSTIQFVSRSNVSFSFVVKIISFIRILVSPLLERAILKEALIKRQDIVFTWLLERGFVVVILAECIN